MIKIYNADNFEKLTRQTVAACLKQLSIAIDDVDIEINFVSAATIQKINNDYRNIDKVTDVLSFQNIPKITLPLQKNDYLTDINGQDNSLILGEIFVCGEVAKKQAIEYGHSLQREIAFLVCHGILHLLGFDHNTPQDEEKMMETTEKILESIDLAADAATEQEAKVDNDSGDTEQFRSGFVAVIGRPNAGKSTLVNTIVGEKVAIVSWKPQTTRNKIMGIYNEKNYQIIFLDTPGLHTPKNNLGKYMMRAATSALEGIDCVIYVIDSEKGYNERDRMNIVAYINAGHKVIAAVNKVDHVTKEKVFEILSELNKLQNLCATVPISALKNKNIEPLKDEIKKLLTDHIKYYDSDQYTDKNMRFMAAEIIREKTLRLLEQEVPYGIGVDIRDYVFNDQKKLIKINADIICEKAAHKPIILGKGGGMIKKIGSYARQDLEAMTGEKVFLSLFVKVKEDWRESDYIMKELGYNK